MPEICARISLILSRSVHSRFNVLRERRLQRTKKPSRYKQTVLAVHYQQTFLTPGRNEFLPYIHLTWWYLCCSDCIAKKWKLQHVHTCNEYKENYKIMERRILADLIRTTLLDFTFCALSLNIYIYTYIHMYVILIVIFVLWKSKFHTIHLSLKMLNEWWYLWRPHISCNTSLLNIWYVNKEKTSDSSMCAMCAMRKEVFKNT